MPSGGASTGGLPDSAAIGAAAASVERLIGEARRSSGAAQDGQLAAAQQALEVSGSGATAPDRSAVAHYCAAAGEVMRLAPDGSQRQAQDYLLTAVDQARAARVPRVAAQAAYRLALVAVSGTSAPAARGAARGTSTGRRNGAQIARTVRSAETGELGGDACGALSTINSDEATSAFVSMIALDCAARVAADAGQHDLAALANLRFGRFATAWADYSDNPQEMVRIARERVLSAFPAAQKVADEALRAELLGRLARTALDLGVGPGPELTSAVDGLRRLATTSAEARGLLADLEARLALKRGDRVAARISAEQAILVQSAKPLPVRLPDLFLLLAEIDPARRTAHVEAAYTSLQNIRPHLPRFDPLTEESTFALYMRKVFESSADVALSDSDTSDDVARIVNAQQVVEAFREAELQSAVGSECLTVRNPMTAADLAEGEVVLYPLIFPDRIELLYAVGTGGAQAARFQRLPVNATANRRDVVRLADALTNGLGQGDEQAWRPAARQLHALLVAPVMPMVKSGATLTIIPDSALRGVPFAALIDDKGDFLVRKVAVTVAPALAYSQPGLAAPDAKRSVVAVSLEREVALPAGTFPALTGTGAEARVAAANGAPGTFVPDFTRVQLIDALSKRQVDVLHLATHASFNGRSDRAFVVANGDVIRLSELRDIIARDRVRGDTLDLLVLSACETAVGDDDESMGLAGAAVQAGALSALASLWQVDDAGTSKLMQQFYGNYRSGQSRALSLRNAQLAMIDAGGTVADPYVWAAFTLIGAWR